MEAMMNRIKWIMTRFADTLGWPGLITLAFIIGFLLYFPFVRWPAQHRLEILATQSLQHGATNSGLAETSASAFLKQMPTPESLPQELQTIFDTAEGYGLLLDEVAYSKVRKQDERLERYHVDFAIDAPYPNIRIFLAEIMAAIPSAALNQLALTRDEVQSGDVHARVRLTLFLVR
jgi:Tfp pilus assembly protein PilO